MSRILRRAGDLPKRSLWQRIKEVALTDVNVLARGGVKAGSLERLEELLLESDFGVPATLKLVADVEQRAKHGEVRTETDFLAALRHGIVTSLRSGHADPALHMADEAPTIMVVIGVNGAGKTTFIGKLAARLRAQGKTVLVAAGDTFRAGAIDQLKVWAERTGAAFVGGSVGGDPAAVAFDAVDAAVTRGIDVVVIDTAGRLHTSGNLMEELKKVVRVVKRRCSDAPHETLLVLDGTIGQNAVAQARTFAGAVPVTGLVVTKVDGTAKGGIVLAVHEAIDVPVKFIGVGEKATDLLPFDAETFANDVLES
jgi:fused signal recognition particle receptor